MKLAGHPYAKEKSLDVGNDEHFAELEVELKDKADDIVFQSASAVFLSTAISQNGKLDAFTVKDKVEIDNSVAVHKTGIQIQT